ncbi:hypothetical protein IWQ61_010525, partial [Dispira simplex]
MIDDKKQNVVPVMEALVNRGLHKQLLNNPKDFLNPEFDEEVTEACYDVSFREGQDIMLKWALADRKEG